MSWLSKFSGLPTLTDIPDAADSFVSGVFSIDTLTSAVNRDWNSTGGNTNAPRAYVDLSTQGTTAVDKLLRVTGRCSAISVVAELNLRRGVALYGPGADDACLSFIVEADAAGSPGVGSAYGRAEENGVTADVGPDALTSCGVPNRFRLYWNDTPEAFEIPDAGFGAWSVAAQTVSYWYSEDDGTTWVRVGDRAINAGVIPTRAAIWAGIDASSGETLTATFSSLEVDEFDFPPQLKNENPDDGQDFWTPEENLYLEVVDPHYFDVDDSTVEIWLDETPVWTGDAQQPGFTVTKTQIDAGIEILGWSYEINPSSDLEEGAEGIGKLHKLRVRAETVSGSEVLDAELLFKVRDLWITNLQNKNHPGATPQSSMGFQDGDGLGDSIEEMIGPENVTGQRWLPGIGGPVDMPGPPGKASFSISFGSFDRSLQHSPQMGFADYDLYGFPTGIAGPSNWLLSILPDLPSALNRGSTISLQGPGISNAQAESYEDPAWHETASFHDGMDFPQSTGGRRYHNYPRDGRGLVWYVREAIDGRDPPQEEASFSDDVFYDLEGEHEYMQDVLDGDGNELAGGLGIMQVQAFKDIDLDSWATPGPGFYGHAKNGVFYHNGLTTQPGVFGAGAGQFNRRSWSDNQGLLASGTINGDTAMVSADHLRINSVGLAGSTDLVQSAYRWWLPSDFEVSIDFSGFSSPSGSAVSARLEMWSDSGYGFLVGVRGDGVYERWTKRNNTWDNNVTVGGAPASGSLKISRVGNTVHMYYYSGTWIEIGTGVDMTRADRCFVRVCCTGTGDIDCTFSNLQIISGGWTNLATWAAEAFSTERGNADAFPDNILAIGTELGLDIVDTDNDLLWMRFIKGDSKLIHNDLAHPLDTAFKNGILIVANNAEVNNEGSTLIVDFNLDCGRRTRYPSAPDNGGFFCNNSGYGGGGAGAIAFRNSANGFSGDYNRWSHANASDSNTSNPHNAVDLLIKNPLVYITGGGKEGLSVFRYTRWNLDEWVTNVDAAWWLTNAEVYWVWWRPQDDMLFWTADDAGDTVIYSQTLANIELPMHGGSFLAGDDKTMPGTRLDPSILLGQHRPAINGADVFVAADDAVWRMTWPGSSWTRWLGPPGSGATYEQLPANLKRITAVRHMKDGSIDLLAVSVDTGVTSQVLIYRLDLGTLYAKTRLIGARTLSSLATAE